MSVQNKRILSTVVYYTLAGLALLMSAFFVYALSVRGAALWVKIVYFIWIGFVAAEIIFDIICTSCGEAKTISGFITYILSVLAVVVACIVYFVNAGVAGLATDFFGLFLSIAIISLMTTGYMIATWCVGESLVEHKTAARAMQKDNRIK